MVYETRLITFAPNPEYNPFAENNEKQALNYCVVVTPYGVGDLNQH